MSEVEAGHEDLRSSIAELAAMIVDAREMADSGQLVELDLLAMRIAVVCDAVASLAPDLAKPLRPALEAALGEVDRLEYTLRRRNVDLTLDLEQADRRLRAQLAYAPPARREPGSKPDQA
jgi:hypothetical protein